MTLVGLSVFQDIAGLALERFANRFQSGEPDRLGLAVFQDRDIGQRDADFVGELGDAHFSLGQHDVDVDDDCHAGLERVSRNVRGLFVV